MTYYLKSINLSSVELDVNNWPFALDDNGKLKFDFMHDNIWIEYPDKPTLFFGGYPNSAWVLTALEYIAFVLGRDEFLKYKNSQDIRYGGGVLWDQAVELGRKAYDNHLDGINLIKLFMNQQDIDKYYHNSDTADTGFGPTPEAVVSTFLSGGPKALQDRAINNQSNIDAITGPGHGIYNPGTLTSIQLDLKRCIFILNAIESLRPDLFIVGEFLDITHVINLGGGWRLTSAGIVTNDGTVNAPDVNVTAIYGGGGWRNLTVQDFITWLQNSGHWSSPAPVPGPPTLTPAPNPQPPAPPPSQNIPPTVPTVPLGPTCNGLMLGDTCLSLEMLSLIGIAVVGIILVRR